MALGIHEGEHRCQNSLPLSPSFISGFLPIPVSRFPSINLPWRRRADHHSPKAREVFSHPSQSHPWMPALDQKFSLGKKKKKERPVSRAFREWSKPTSVLLSSYSLVLPLHSSNSHRLLLPFFPRFSSSPPLSCCSLTNSWAPHTLPPDSRASADCHRNQKKPAHRPKVALCSFSWSLTSEPFFRQPVTQQCEHRRNFRAALARLFHFQREMDELNHSAVLHRPNTTGKTCTHLCENASEPHSTRY